MVEVNSVNKLTMAEFFRHDASINAEESAEQLISDIKSGEQKQSEENDELQEGEIESMQSILNEQEF